MKPWPVIFAQTEEAPATPTESAASEPPTSPDYLPHGKFLVDYLLVLALFAGALYAVCRSSRRV